MDAIVRDVLQFDRFELDLGLSCLRIGGQTIDLRPKAFAVLRLLAENAGQLVAKDTLYQTVWPDTAVGDDSLSQCIHELRQILGDKNHRLIRTVSRRGYVLDAERATHASVEPDRHEQHATGRRRWTAIGASLAVNVVLGLVLLSVLDIKRPVLAVMNEWAGGRENLMSDADAKRIAALAATKELPLPTYRIYPPAPDVAESDRRFLGVWVTDSGWTNSNRQLMMIVTGIGRDGSVTGYFVNGPAKPHSRIPGAAFSGSFSGYISNGTLRYDGSSGMHLAAFMPDGRIEFRLAFQDGAIGVALLDPAWTPGQARTCCAPGPQQPALN